MTLIKLELMLHSFIVEQRAACHTLSNAFLKSTKTWKRPVGFKGTFHTVFSG